MPLFVLILALFGWATFNVFAMSKPPLTPVKAAEAAANGPACTKQAPFYWEIGDALGPKASGSVGTGVTASTSMAIASASKIYYSAYVAQVRAGAYNANDIKFMTFRSGYSDLASCRAFDTVASCAARAPFNPESENLFDYGGGHMQKHASMNLLGEKNAASLAMEVNRVLGTGVSYGSPQPAGGITTTPTETAAFLRAVISGKLELGNQLGVNKVCTICGEALSSPVPEPWYYGMGHWVETDGTFSSAGAFGYYPWISADKKLYGLVARKVMAGAWPSVTCGRAIREAYQAGR